MTAVIFSGHWEWIVVLVIALLLFGHRIPGMARSLGSGITEFKKGLKKGEGEDDDPGTKSPKSLPDEQTASTLEQSQAQKSQAGRSTSS